MGIGDIYKLFKSEEYKWIVMDKDRTVIAKGSPGEKYLISINDKKDNKRILFYSTKNRAKNCNDGSFYNNSRYPNYKYHVEPVKVKITIEEIEE